MKLHRAAWALVLLSATSSSAGTEVYQRDELADALGLRPYSRLAHPEKVKIAVLDNGFREGNENLADFLPASAQIVDTYPQLFLERNHLATTDAPNPPQATRHGLSMAQIVWSMSGKRPEGPQFYLLNANGFTNLRRAVAYAVEQKVDIILYSQTWEYGGNFDGKGFINAVVNQATQAGILWVNAAGNAGGLVYDAPLKFVGQDQYLAKLPGKGNTLRFKNRFDENPVTITVSWNDFQETEDYHTGLDLDVDLLDGDGNVVAQGNRAQVDLSKYAGYEGREPTVHARELFSTVLSRGEYRLQIRRATGDFTAQSRIRVTLRGDKSEESLELVDAPAERREIMIPADNASVITVGDKTPSASVGRTADGRMKPDFVLASSDVKFTNGLITSGTSNAAALFAGALVVLKSVQPGLTRERLLADLQKSSPVPSCLTTSDLAQVPYPVLRALELTSSISHGRWAVGENAEHRLTIVLDIDPLTLSPLFDNAVTHARTHAKQSGDYRYYLAASANPAQGWQGVQSLFYLRDTPAASVPFGDLGWIEIVPAAGDRGVCANPLPLWRAPEPKSL